MSLLLENPAMALFRLAAILSLAIYFTCKTENPDLKKIPGRRLIMSGFVVLLIGTGTDLLKSFLEPEVFGLSAAQIGFIGEPFHLAGVLIIFSGFYFWLPFLAAANKTALKLDFESRINTSISELAEALVLESSGQQALRACLDHALHLTGSPYGMACEIDPDTGKRIRSEIGSGVLDDCRIKNAGLLPRHLKGILSYGIEHKKPLIVNRAETDPRFSGIPPGHVPISRFVSVPVLKGEKVFGLICAANSGRDYGQKDIMTIEKISRLCCMASARLKREKELKAALVKAASAHLAKSSFLRSVGHELRTPLNMIFGFAQLLEKDKDLNRKQAEYAGQILDASKRLVRLTEKVLERSSMDFGDMKLLKEPASVCGFLSGIMDSFKPAAAKKDITLKRSLSERLSGLNLPLDINKLKAAFHEILDNAARFTPRNGEITLCADLAPLSPGEKKPGFIRIGLKDNGIGIHRKDKDKIFDDFFQSYNEKTGKPRGLGLGLGIVRRIVEAHGGRVEAESNGPGKGLGIILFLPIKPEKKPVTKDKKAGYSKTGRPVSYKKGF